VKSIPDKKPRRGLKYVRKIVPGLVIDGLVYFLAPPWYYYILIYVLTTLGAILLDTYFVKSRLARIYHRFYYALLIRPFFGRTYPHDAEPFNESFLEREIIITLKDKKEPLRVPVPKWKQDSQARLDGIEARVEVHFKYIKLRLHNEEHNEINVSSVQVARIADRRQEKGSEFQAEVVDCKSITSRPIGAGKSATCHIPSDFPLVVKGEHILHWPKREYTILLLADPDHRLSIDRGKGKGIKVNIDLGEISTQYGIYNNEGKRFLGWKYETEHSSPEREKELFDASARLHGLFMNPAADSTFRLDLNRLRIPLRWASGGYIPRIKWNEREWVALFFRDIRPLGLNAAIGASERKNELRDPRRVIEREFSEEFVVVDKDWGEDESFEAPKNTPKMIRQEITVIQPQSTPSEIDYLHQYVRLYQKTRRKHDRVDFIEEDRGTTLYTVPGPFDVKVASHGSAKDVFFSINPLELGIEVIWLCQGEDIDASACMIDGEMISPSDHTLIRQPVILLDVNYLKRIFKENEKMLGKGTLGEIVRDDVDRRECMVLGELDKDTKKLKPNQAIPWNEIHIFSHDVASRHRRLAILDNKAKRTKAENDEQVGIHAWLEKNEGMFREAKRLRDAHEAIADQGFRTLCPAAWKTLELAIKHEKL